jgi:transmembrane protein TMEM260 (protein O-mannosyltransferase)
VVGRICTRLFLRKGGSIAVAIAFAVPLVILLATVRTSVGFWDTGDLQTVAWIAGIPYPTGYPLYVVVGWLWTHAIPIATVAARLNALSAIAVAAGAATVCGLALVLEVGAAIAVLAGWTFAFAHTIWYRGTYADAHPVGFAVAFLALAFAVRWAVRGDARNVVGAILLGAVALAFDNTTVLILAGGLVLALARRLPLKPAALAALAAVLIVVASYAYLPLRSAQLSAAGADPTLQLGIPPGRPFWDDHHPSTLQGFRALVAGSDWGPGTTLAQVLSFDAIGKTEKRFGPDIGGDFPPGFALAALIGIAFLAYRLPLIALGLVVAAVLPALFGGSYRVEADPERYAFALFAVTSLGFALAADRVTRAVVSQQRRTAHALAIGLLAATVLWQLWQGADILALRDNREAATLGATVAAATRDDAVVIVRWDWATPLAYRAYVEHRFGTRIVLCGFPEDYAGRYGDWIGRRQVAIVAEATPALYGYAVHLLRAGHPSVYELTKIASSAR